MVSAVADVSQVRARLREHKDLLQQYGVERLEVFGSVARGEASKESDVDVLVEFGRPMGAFKVIRFEQALSQILGRTVDLVTMAALKPRLRDSILQEAVRAI